MGILFFIIIVVGAYFVIVKSLNGFVDYLFKDETEKDNNTYIDKSQHTHFHVHTSTKSKEIKELENYIDIGKD